MNKETITPQTLLQSVEEFYDPKRWRYLTVNATDNGTALEIDWIFVAIGENRPLRILTCTIDYETPLPSLAKSIPASELSEAEMFDLVGVRFEGAKAGLFLEPDAPRMPLRKTKDRSGD